MAFWFVHLTIKTSPDDLAFVWFESEIIVIIVVFVKYINIIAPPLQMSLTSLHSTCLQAIPKVFFCTFYHQCLIEIFETNKPCTSISIRPDYSIHLFMSIESRIRYKSVLNEITTTVIIIYIGWKKIPQEWKREMFRNDSVQVQNPCEKHMFVILQPVKLKNRGILFWF